MFARTCLALGLLALVAACVVQPPGGPTQPIPPRVPSASVLTDGANVWIGNRPARYGDQIRPGQSVRTGPNASALIEFDDGTTIQLDERTDPVRFDWGRGRGLTLQFDDAVFWARKGGFFEYIEALGALADIFSFSEFVVEERNPRFFRVDLFQGSVQFRRPPVRDIRGGEFAEIRPGRPAKIGRLTRQRERDLRRRFERWTFSRTVEPIDLQVPNVQRLTLREARQRLRSLGLGWEVIGSMDRDATVIRQRPGPGARVAKGSVVELRTRDEAPTPAMVSVPNVQRITLGEARRILRNRGLRWEVAGPVDPDAIVTRQRPGPRTQVTAGAVVQLTTRLDDRSPVTVTVPSVVGLSRDDAAAVLRRTGLRLGRTSPADPPRRYRVYRQIPLPRERVPEGTSVTLYLGDVVQ